MKFVFAAAVACAALFAVSDDALAQAKKKSGLTCAQQCSNYCQGRHHNCFDRCSSIKCAGK